MTVQSGPLTQALLHTLTHPSNDVYGLLIGPSIHTPEVVTRVVPLFHSRCISTPLLRIALSLVERSLSSGSTIVGVYCAEATSSQASVTAVARLIASQICKTFKLDSLVCWAYDSKKAGYEVPQWPFKGFNVKPDESLTQSSMKPLVTGYSSEDVHVFISSYHKKDTSLSSAVVDMEDHLQDPTKEWLISV